MISKSCKAAKAAAPPLNVAIAITLPIHLTSMRISSGTGIIGDSRMNAQLSGQAPDPAQILQTAAAFWPSKVLLTATELGVFTALGRGAMTATELGERLKLHPRGTYDFFDALVALKFLDRDGDGPVARY